MKGKKKAGKKLFKPEDGKKQLFTDHGKKMKTVKTAGGELGWSNTKMESGVLIDPDQHAAVVVIDAKRKKKKTVTTVSVFGNSTISIHELAHSLKQLAEGMHSASMQEKLAALVGEEAAAGIDFDNLPDFPIDLGDGTGLAALGPFDAKDPDVDEKVKNAVLGMIAKITGENPEEVVARVDKAIANGDMPPFPSLREHAQMDEEAAARSNADLDGVLRDILNTSPDPTGTVDGSNEQGDNNG